MKLFSFILMFLLILGTYSCGETDCLNENNEGCGMNEEVIYEEEFDDVQIEEMGTKAVAYTKLETSTHYIENDDSLPEGQVNHILKGEIEVKNLAPQKEVIIHYIGTDNVTWHTVAAYYVGPSQRMGYEYWKFFVRTPYTTQISDKFYSFKIQYRVFKNNNWLTYWDNNAGRNYFRTYYINIVKLKKVKYYTTSNPIPYTMNHILEAEIEVKNVSFNKTVALHHVGAEGKWIDTQGYYLKKSTKKNHEIWKVIINTPIYKYPPQDFYRFAVKYDVRSDEYWDNNNNQDYYGMTYGTTPR